jgi:hypothetical protein
VWLMTKYGFYSIVEKQSDEYHVRAREEKDLENLIAGVPLPNAVIRLSWETDYLARIIVKKEDVLKIMAFLGNNLDYSNFKDKIDKTPTQAHKPYHKVWQVLADALGAYGQEPTI